jgi:hypothetical protein
MVEREGRERQTISSSSFMPACRLAASANKALFGVLEVVAADHRGGVVSKRYKYIFVTFVGSGIPEINRATFNFSKGPVNQFLSGTAMTLDLRSNVPQPPTSPPPSLPVLTAFVCCAQTLNDMNAKDIATKLLAAGGAHKPNKFVFGPGDEISVDDLASADSDDD